MEKETKQSAVDSILAKLNNVNPTEFCSIETIKEWCQQAKEMEKEQIIDAFNIGFKDSGLSYVIGEIYYRQTYGGNKIFVLLNDKNGKQTYRII
jgi:hypothetical protein